MSLKPLESFAEICDHYGRVYCDIWGVVHNGMQQTPSAVEALTRFRAGGGQVALVSNAPRPNQYVQEMLASFGISKAAYDAIVTSGDVTRDLIKNYRGKIIHHVGPEYDRNLFDGTGVFFGPAEEAEILVVSDMDEKGEDISLYDDRLKLWRDLGLKMVCANPDKVVEVGDQLVVCGGALADLYEEVGGEVEMAGKPFAPIYDAAKARLTDLGLPQVSCSKTLAIGDAARTDAMGAANQNLDFIFITGSIHADELHANPEHTAVADAKKVEALMSPTNVHAVGYMKTLR